MPDNTYISCGRMIPEGRHVCLACEKLKSIRGCADCVLTKDGVDRCPVASMCEKPVNPAHGCSWKTSINRKTIRTNGDRIRAMSNRELAELISKDAPYCKRVSGIVPVCSGGRDCIDCVQEWLESEV